MRSRSDASRIAKFIGGPLCGRVYERRTADRFPRRLDITVGGVVYSYIGRVSAGLAIYRHAGPVAVEGVK